MGKMNMGRSDVTVRTARTASVPVVIASEPEVITKIEYVDRIVEVPVEKIVMVDRPVETIVERIVEKIVEKIVCIPEIKEVTRFVDRPVEVVREVLVHDIAKLLAEKESVRKLKKSNNILKVGVVALVISLIISIVRS
jgi:hypothetical protein